MRNPMFRAWDAKNRKFALTDFHVIGECTVFDLVKQYELENLLELDITQAVGLQDVNGVEVYEGDHVIEQYSPSTDPNSLIDTKVWSKKVGTVVWVEKQHRFGVEYMGNANSVSHLPHGTRSSEIKVVGNKYE